MHPVWLVAHSADVQMLAFVLVFRYVASSTLLKSVFLTREHTLRVFIPSTCIASACSISLCSCAEWGILCALHCFLGKKGGRKARTQHAFKPVLLDLLRQAQMSQNTFIQELSPSERAALGTPERHMGCQRLCRPYDVLASTLGASIASTHWEDNTAGFRKL